MKCTYCQLLLSDVFSTESFHLCYLPLHTPSDDRTTAITLTTLFNLRTLAIYLKYTIFERHRIFFGIDVSSFLTTSV